ncbi:transposase [Streptomyces hirsutus]|uniref:transposase n=1 Tax=Streptomyces hirsutus TaxID=35620 RepID=UPI0033BA68C2
MRPGIRHPFSAGFAYGSRLRRRCAPHPRNLRQRAADPVEAAPLALARLPKRYRRGRQTLLRTDSAGGTHTFVTWLAKRDRWLSYSVGMPLTDALQHSVLEVPPATWTPAGGTGRRDPRRRPDRRTRRRPPHRPAEAKGMRLTVRREHPYPGAQLRLAGADGMRLTAFATHTTDIPIARLELRHRRRARAEDRVRTARATGLRNLPLPDAAPPQVSPTITSRRPELPRLRA